MTPKSVRPWILGLAVAALAACGGGGSSDSAPTGSAGGPPVGGSGGVGTLRISLTDSPACGYDNAWITVEKVRVHRNSAAGDGDAGWIDLPLPQQQPLPVPAPTPQPLRVDLLTLTNGVLVPLGEVQLPAGTYTQLRLVLAENTAANPLANAIKPSGGAIVPLTTPSAQQSGLKMNVNMTVPAGQEADFAIDFDACKSFVKAGKSGKILLKPVLSVLPILYPAGQRIQGWLHPSLATAGATVSVQSHGEVVRATPPVLDSGGNLRFELYPVPVGTYDLVVTANGHATATVTGVPAHAGSSTTVNSVAFPILPPLSGVQTVSGTVTFDGSAVDTGGVVRALQLQSGGPTIEVASANARQDDGFYELTLPVGAPVKAPYVTGTVPLVFSSDGPAAGHYRLAATVVGSTEVKYADIVLGASPVQQNFDFVLPPAGQLIQGWLDQTLAAASGTVISVQMNGTVVQTTPPLTDGSGKFVLYPVPVGTYDLVVTTSDRATAVVTGVPSIAGSDTTINGDAFRINPTVSPRVAVHGQVKVNGIAIDTGGVVRALQTLGSGPTVQVASDNARATDGLYGMLLANGAALVAPYMAGAEELVFAPAAGAPGHYTLSATVAGSATVMTADIVVALDPVVQDFLFTAP